MTDESRTLWCAICEDDHQSIGTLGGMDAFTCPSVGTPRWPGTRVNVPVIWDNSETEAPPPIVDVPELHSSYHYPPPAWTVWLPIVGVLLAAATICFVLGVPL